MLAHDNTKIGSPVSTEYFEQGAIVDGTPYFYVKDRLGSVEEIVSGGGSIDVQYTYDPYGNQVTISGALVSDVGYAGYFRHAASGLEFALFRAYDPFHARWLNRDPIGEIGGINLYGYVGGLPTSKVDSLGTCCNGFKEDFWSAFERTDPVGKLYSGIEQIAGAKENVDKIFDFVELGGKALQQGLFFGRVVGEFASYYARSSLISVYSENVIRGTAALAYALSCPAEEEFLDYQLVQGFFSLVGLDYSGISTYKPPELVPTGWSQDEFSVLTSPQQ